MMTARAEHRLWLRQENADERLTPIGREVGLVDDRRYGLYLKKLEELASIRKALEQNVSAKRAEEFLNSVGGEYSRSAPCKFSDLLRRSEVTAGSLKSGFEEFSSFSDRCMEEVATEIKYAGYLEKQKQYSEKMRRLEEKALPDDIDYGSIEGLRIEARQKLSAIRPADLGQASRISGVSPADITVLIVWLARNKK